MMYSGSFHCGTNTFLCLQKLYFQLLSVICLTSRTNAGLPLQAQVDYDPELMQPDTRFFAKVTNHLN